MAQIFGYLSSHPQVEANAVGLKMGRLLRRPTQDAAEVWSDPANQCTIGAVLQHERGAFSALTRLAGSKVVALDGWVEVGGAPPSDQTSTLAERYEKLGGDLARGLGGSFALALYDDRHRKLILATDRLSTRGLSWLKMPGGIAFSSELKGLLAIPGWQAQYDPQAISTYLRYGRLFGRRTMCRNVELLPPGRTLVYDAAADTVTEHVSGAVEEVVAERMPLTRERLHAIGEAFARGVSKGCLNGGKVGLSLSGGLDSRAILAVLAQQRANTFMRTEGLDGCMDQRVGARLASATGFPWHFEPLKTFDIESYVEATRRYVYLTEGMLVPEGFPGIGPIRFAQEEGLSVLQRGHGGENARVGDAWPFQIKDEQLKLQSREQLSAMLEPPANGQQSDWAGLFADPEVERAIGEPEDTLTGFAATIDHSLTPAETMNLLYLRINDGGQVTAFRNCLRGYADMALPFLDNDFLSLVLGTRIADRRGEEIHYHLIRHHCPALMKVPNSNHGAPLDASRFRRLATEKSHALFRKLRLPGFRHYHDADAWIQKVLRDSVRSCLLDPRSTSRGLLNPQHLKTIIDNPSLPGRPRLLARLVTIEMWGHLFNHRGIDTYKLDLIAR